MKPFPDIAKPNRDVLSGPANLAKYAADLNAVAIGGGGPNIPVLTYSGT